MRYFVSVLLSVSLGWLPPVAWAQDAVATEPIPEPVVPLVAEAGADKNVAFGRNVLFNASASSGPTDQTINYTWDFGDGQSFQGIDASHIYAQPGTYKVKLTATAGEQLSRDTLLVSVAEDVVLLIADDTVSKDQLRYYRQYAQRSGTLLVTVRPHNGSTLDYVLTRNIAEQLVSSEADLSQAKVVVIWTEPSIGLNALTEVGRILNSSGSLDAAGAISFAQKAIVHISDRPSSGALGRIAQTTYNTLTPQYVMLTTLPALESVLANPAVDKLASQLNSQSVPYQLIGQHSQRVLETITPLNFLSYGINYLINKGVNQDTIFLLLILPIVATLISFGRQIVGVKAFGIYVPSIMTLSFVVTGLRYGVLIFLVLLAAATLARIAARRLRILYLPRMAIVLTAVSFTIIGLLWVSAYFGETSILALSIFPVLVMMILTEKFVEVQIEQGNRQAIILTTETLVLATLSYFIVTWEEFTTVILGYPELVLLTVVINILLGRFSGLRIVEYFRFRKLLKTNVKP